MGKAIIKYENKLKCDNTNSNKTLLQLLVGSAKNLKLDQSLIGFNTPNATRPVNFPPLSYNSHVTMFSFVL